MSTVLHGFTVIAVQFSGPKNYSHYMYIKEHSVREMVIGKPSHKTLFVVNVPPFCGKGSLTHIFKEYGTIQQIYLHSTPTAALPEVNKSVFFPDVPSIEGYRVAYIVFKDNESVQKALSATCTPKLVPSDVLELTGIKRWCREYSEDYVETTKLESEIEAFMMNYDAEQTQKAERLKQEAMEPDDEGWVKVTRHGKFKGNPRTEEHEQYAKADQRKKRKKAELSNFYTFQVRESKMKHVAKLRQQFKEDKEKVARLKAARKFKPY